MKRTWPSTMALATAVLALVAITGLVCGGKGEYHPAPARMEAAKVDVDSRRMLLIVRTQEIADRTGYKIGGIAFTETPTITTDEATVLFVDKVDKRMEEVVYEWESTGPESDDGRWARAGSPR